MAKKTRAGEMTEDDAALIKAMEDARKKHPPLGSPAWAKQQAENRDRR